MGVNMPTMKNKKIIEVKCPAKTTSALGEQSEPIEMRCPALDAGSQELRVKCPAKINLTLEILNKREDGFHNIQSIMQAINLFDILTIKIEESDKFEIKLSGTSDEIPYDERNLVYKAAELFFKNRRQEGKKERRQAGKNLPSSPLALLPSFNISIHIEKHIPVAAGLAGGSTDAAGTLWGLNQLFDNILSKEELHQLCAELGSDLNFCLEGGCQLATGRGEILKKLPFQEFCVSLIKPKNLGISAKETYTKFSALENKPNLNMTEKLLKELKKNDADIEKYIHNDLETAIINDYKELQEIKMEYPESIMSGSGSTFFVIGYNFKNFNENYQIIPDLKSIPQGISRV